jgi:phosphoglycerate dehydrogenase-like enzyme
VTKIILAAPQVRQDRVDQIRARFPDVEFVVPANRDELLDQVGDTDAVFGRLSNTEFLAAEKLRWIQSASAGVEWMWDIPSIANSDVVVTNMRGAHAETIADHTFGLLLTLTRGLLEFRDAHDRHEWVRGQVKVPLVCLRGMTMAILGFGNIGKQIAKRAVGFDLTIFGVDVQPVEPTEGVESVWPISRLTEACRRADILVISAPITPETRGLVGREQLQAMKQGSYVVAVSRGGIVDEPALIEALESGHLAGAGLDVTNVEPLPANDPLWNAPRLLITPHNSAASSITTDLVWGMLAENIVRFQRGETLLNAVDKRRGY